MKRNLKDTLNIMSYLNVHKILITTHANIWNIHVQKEEKDEGELSCKSIAPQCEDLSFNPPEQISSQA